MYDSRLDQLARQLATYSLRIKKGEKVLIDLYDTPSEMGVAMIRAVRAVGGVPFVNVAANSKCMPAKRNTRASPAR